MKREEIEEYLFDFIEEELSPELMKQIENTLSQFPDLEEEVSQQRAVKNQLTNLQPNIPTNLEGDILDYVRKKERIPDEVQALENVQIANNNTAFLGWLPTLVVAAAIGLFFILPAGNSTMEVEQAGVISTDTIIEQATVQEPTTQPLEKVNLEGNRMIVVMGEKQIQELQNPSRIAFQPTSPLFLHELDVFLQSHSGQWSSLSGNSRPFELNEVNHRIEIVLPSQQIAQFNHFMTKHGYHWSPISNKDTAKIQKISIELRYQD